MWSFGDNIAGKTAYSSRLGEGTVSDKYKYKYSGTVRACIVQRSVKKKG